MNSQHQAHSSSDPIQMTSNVLYGESPVYSPHGVDPPPPNYAPPPPVPHIPPSPTPPVSPPHMPYPPPSVSPLPHSTTMPYPQHSIASSLERQIIDMNIKLSKLLLLDNILHRLALLEQQYEGSQHDLARTKTEVHVVAAKADQSHEHCNYISDKVTTFFSLVYPNPPHLTGMKSHSKQKSLFLILSRISCKSTRTYIFRSTSLKT